MDGTLNFNNVNLSHFTMNEFLSDVVVINERSSKEYK